MAEAKLSNSEPSHSVQSMTAVKNISNHHLLVTELSPKVNPAMSEEDLPFECSDSGEVRLKPFTINTPKIPTISCYRKCLKDSTSALFV